MYTLAIQNGQIRLVDVKRLYDMINTKIQTRLVTANC